MPYNLNNKDVNESLHFLFTTERLFEDVESCLKKGKCDLLVLDGIGDTLQSNANDLFYMRSVLHKWHQLAVKYDCCVCFIHHTTKGAEKHNPDKNKLNGSQAIEAKVRCLLELRLGGKSNERYLTVTKANYLSREEKEKSVVLDLDPDTLLFSNTGTVLDINTRQIEKAKYAKDVWMPRMHNLRNEGLSYEAARAKLVEQYPTDEVPKVTWFKNNKEPGVQSELSNDEKPKGDIVEQIANLNTDYGAIFRDNEKPSLE